MATIISAKLRDQQLTLTTSPIVASGGVAEDAVEFAFDASWDGYEKTAVFYRDKSCVYHVGVASDNTAVIPWEVLQYEGYMFLGVFGTKDGITKPSAVARYRIHQGAIALPSAEPTPPGSTAANKKYVDDAIAAAVGNAIGGSY